MLFFDNGRRCDWTCGAGLRCRFPSEQDQGGAIEASSALGTKCQNALLHSLLGGVWGYF